MEYRGHDIVPADDGAGFEVRRKDGGYIGRFAREREAEEFLFVCIVAAGKVPTRELWEQYTRVQEHA